MHPDKAHLLLLAKAHALDLCACNGGHTRSTLMPWGDMMLQLVRNSASVSR
jgi:hypothetical protein